MAHAAKSSPEVLNSWKQIAAYFDRGVRTVQRWENELRLPVHRIGNGKRSPVYALVPELKFWLTASGPGATARQMTRFPAPQERDKDSPLKVSHQLIERSQYLVRTMAETSLRQQRQAETLMARVLEIRSRIR